MTRSPLQQPRVLLARPGALEALREAYGAIVAPPPTRFEPGQRVVVEVRAPGERFHTAYLFCTVCEGTADRAAVVADHSPPAEFGVVAGQRFQILVESVHGLVHSIH